MVQPTKAWSYLLILCNLFPALPTCLPPPSSPPSSLSPTLSHKQSGRPSWVGRTWLVLLLGPFLEALRVCLCRQSFISCHFNRFTSSSHFRTCPAPTYCHIYSPGFSHSAKFHSLPQARKRSLLHFLLPVNIELYSMPFIWHPSFRFATTISFTTLPRLPYSQTRRQRPAIFSLRTSHKLPKKQK